MMMLMRVKFKSSIRRLLVRLLIQVIKPITKIIRVLMTSQTQIMTMKMMMIMRT